MFLCPLSPHLHAYTGRWPETKMFHNVMRPTQCNTTINTHKKAKHLGRQYREPIFNTRPWGQLDIGVIDAAINFRREHTGRKMSISSRFRFTPAVTLVRTKSSRLAAVWASAWPSPSSIFSFLHSAMRTLKKCHRTCQRTSYLDCDVYIEATDQNMPNYAQTQRALIWELQST